MHKYFINLLLVLLLSSFSENNRRDYRIECKSSTEGFQTITIWNLKQKHKYKIEDASKDAIHAFLFSGIEPGLGCILIKPLLSTEQEKEKFKSFEKSFFKNKYQEFIRSSSITFETIQKTYRINYKVYTITVSKDLLRKYLEDQNIISSLSKGF